MSSHLHPRLMAFCSQEDRALALQRQSLRQRHLPESDDRVGEDPLAPLAGETTSASHGEEGSTASGESSNDQPFREQQDGVSFACGGASAGPVRLELGMDAEVLDKILDEIEVCKSEQERFWFFSFVVLSLFFFRVYLAAACSFWFIPRTQSFPWCFGFTLTSLREGTAYTVRIES